MELPSISEAALRQRSRAILLGMASAEAATGPVFHSRFALELGESLLRQGSVDRGLLLERWSRLGGDARPPAGSITGEAIHLFREGFPAEGLGEAAARLIPNRSGDGPLPRALPVAIAARRDGATLKRWAERSASATHADITSRMAAVASSLLARDLLTRGLEESLARVGQALREEAPLRLSQLFRHPRPGDPPEPGDDAVAVLSQAVGALNGAGDLEGALDEAEVDCRPGSATLALTGGLAGAAFGIDLNSPRLRRLETGLRERLDALAEGLVSFELSQRGPRPASSGLAPHRSNGSGIP
ncbi:MAG: ADP-ribosylglycohydrolase family protein [Candidatus Dormibacteria bacterium]